MGTIKPILKVQALRAFKGVKVKYLERLYVILKVAAKRPEGEKPLVRALIVAVIPDLDGKADELEAILALRFQPNEAELIPTSLSPEELSKNPKTL